MGCSGGFEFKVEGSRAIFRDAQLSIFFERAGSAGFLVGD